MHYLAQIASDNAVPVLFTYGPLGVVLAWFMLRGEKLVVRISTFETTIILKLSDLAHRVDGLTKALLVDMIERENSGEHVRQYAREAIAKIEARAAQDDRGYPRKT